MTSGRGAAVRQALAVDVHLHGRRFIVAEFTAFAALFAGLSVAIVAAALRVRQMKGCHSWAGLLMRRS